MKTRAILCAVVAAITTWFGLIALGAEPAPPQSKVLVPADSAQAVKSAVEKSRTAVAMSKSVSEVVQLTKAGLDAKVIQTYLEHSNSTLPPSADEIVYMREQGVSQDIITALILRGSAVRSATIQVATQDDRVRDAMLGARQQVMFANAYQSQPSYFYAPYGGYGYGYGGLGYVGFSVRSSPSRHFGRGPSLRLGFGR